MLMRNLLAAIGVAAVLGAGAIGCDGSNAGAGGATGATGAEAEAEQFALAELQKHWTKTADGWTTARTSGSDFAPIRYLRQARALEVQGVETFDLSEADRMNGFEWVGQVSFKQTPCREAGEQGLLLEGLADVQVFRGPGQWTQWVDFKPEPMRVHKLNGQWRAEQDTWLLRGAVPSAADYAGAGVQPPG